MSPTRPERIHTIDIATFAIRSNIRRDHVRSESLRRTYREIPDSMKISTTGDLPAVSVVKPSGFTDGHPASSKLDLFEGFTKKIIESAESESGIVGDHGRVHHL